ncbi:MAG: hypothetical protein ACYTFY_19205 [Planctomycetota bacterium]|jgi:hypothetical protein
MTNTKYLTTIALSLILLTGCGPNIHIEKANYTFMIDKGGKGSISLDFINITPIAKGEKGEQEIKELIKDVNDGAYDFFAETGLIKRKQTIERNENGILNANMRGEFEDIFCLPKLIDSSKPYLLYKDKTLLISWAKSILKIDLGFNPIKEERKADKDGSEILFIFKTTGKFLDGTVGKISKDRKTTTIDESSGNKIVLIIEGLAE